VEVRIVRNSVWIPVVFALGGALSACGAPTDGEYGDRDRSPGVNEDAAREAETDADEDRDARSTADAEALAYLVAVDEHEVQAGAEAAKKDLSAEVLDFARTMQDEHGKHASQTRGLANTLGIELSDPSSVAALKEKTANERRSMAALQPEEFERKYVESMVKDHEDALAKIDEFLDGDLRLEVQTHLRASRGAIAHHLEMARALQLKLDETASSETPK
jgi:putative membrane protein